MVAHCHLISSIQTTRIHWFIGSWTWKEEGYEGHDSYLTLSTLLRGTKLGCQKLRHCLSKYFFVGSSSTTKIMSQNYLKIVKIYAMTTKICAQGAVGKGRHPVKYHSRSCTVYEHLIGNIYQVLLSDPLHTRQNKSGALNKCVCPQPTCSCLLYVTASDTLASCLAFSIIL